MSLSRVVGLRSWHRAVQANGAVKVCAPLLGERWFGSGSALQDKVATKAVQKLDWNRAVNEAEKIVGYPTSFLSLRWLLNDEIANVALHLRKLVGSNHPLLRTAKILIHNGKNNMQTWGLIVLLISKAAGQAPSVAQQEPQDEGVGILTSQRTLAEITEMIRTAHLVHQGLVNLQPLSEAGNELGGDSEAIFGNKIALLSGDYLLGNACLQLAMLRNQELIELISSAVRDLAESSFVGDRDQQNNPLPSKPAPAWDAFGEELDGELTFAGPEGTTKPLSLDGVLGHPEKEWSLRGILGAGSLLGKGCQGALMLAGSPVQLQQQGYLFGKHLSLAWQACLDIETFCGSTLPHGSTFSLVSAPVLFHLAHDPTLYEEIAKGRDSVANVDYARIHGEIVKGPGVERTRELQKKHSLAAMVLLNELPESDSRTALQNIILAMQDV